MENAAHTVQLSEAGGSLAGCEVSHSHTNTQRIIRAAHNNIHGTGGMTARLLKASELPRVCAFSQLMIYFTTLFVERKSVKWTEKKGGVH